MVRLFVEQRARVIGLDEGVTSFTQLRLKSMHYGSINFAVFSFLNTTIWHYSSLRQPFCHKVKFVFTFSLSVRPYVHSYKDSVIAHESML